MSRFEARRRAPASDRTGAGTEHRRMGTDAAHRRIGVGRGPRRIALASVLAAALAGGLAACGTGRAGEAALDPPDPGTDTDNPAAQPAHVERGGAGTCDLTEQGELPRCHGRLHEAEVSLTIRAGDLLVRVVPLDESVTRLTAPDTYRRLHATAERYAALLRAEAPGNAAGTESAGRDPSLFLVTLFSRSADVGYEPEALYLSSGGRRFRPVWIGPVTPGWGGGRLPQQESRSAVYAFPAEVDLADPDLVVGYGDRESDEWERILRRLEVERGRVRARASGG